MTMDDQIQAAGGFDGADPKTRFKAMMRAKRIKMSYLLSLGYDKARMTQLLTSTEMLSDSDIHELQKLCSATGIDYNFVITGVLPKNLTKIEAERLRIYRLLEKFCAGLWLDPHSTTQFINDTMRKIELVLDSPEYALYEKGIPESLENVEDIYRLWGKA